MKNISLPSTLPLTTDQRQAFLLVLHEQGDATYGEIATMLGVSYKTIMRDLHALSVARRGPGRPPKHKKKLEIAHGTHARYKKGCRCEECLAHHRFAHRMRNYKNRGAFGPYERCPTCGDLFRNLKGVRRHAGLMHRARIR